MGRSGLPVTVTVAKVWRRILGTDDQVPAAFYWFVSGYWYLARVRPLDEFRIEFALIFFRPLDDYSAKFWATLFYRFPEVIVGASVTLLTLNQPVH